MFWQNLLVILLLFGQATPAPAREAAAPPTQQGRDELERLGDLVPSIRRLRDFVAPATDKAYSKCLATFAQPDLCECITQRIPLRLALLCYIKVVDNTEE